MLQAPEIAAKLPARLLNWYDANRRRLPWRAPPGRQADPYAVWLSEIMLQQTGVKAVAPYFEKFLTLWPDVEALAAAPVEAVMQAWAGLGYYSRARSLHRCAQIVAGEFGGRFPADEAALLNLPGVGPYTAAAVAAIAFGRRAVVVDGNVERVITRVFRIDMPLPKAKPAIREAAAHVTPATRAGDFAQAMMDLGSAVCTPRKPACALCPVLGLCAAGADGSAENFPRKAARTARPMRGGAAYYIRWRGQVLVRRRPPRGLLGGMTEFPGGDWSLGADPPPPAFPGVPPQAIRLAGDVRHVFTHFTLNLRVYVAECAPDGLAGDELRWVEESLLGELALPTLMRKAALVARRAL